MQARNLQDELALFIVKVDASAKKVGATGQRARQAQRGADRMQKRLEAIEGAVRSSG